MKYWLLQRGVYVWISFGCRRSQGRNQRKLQQKRVFGCRKLTTAHHEWRGDLGTSRKAIFHLDENGYLRGWVFRAWGHRRSCQGIRPQSAEQAGAWLPKMSKVFEHLKQTNASLKKMASLWYKAIRNLAGCIERPREQLRASDRCWREMQRELVCRKSHWCCPSASFEPSEQKRREQIKRHYRDSLEPEQGLHERKYQWSGRQETWCPWNFLRRLRDRLWRRSEDQSRLSKDTAKTGCVDIHAIDVWANFNLFFIASFKVLRFFLLYHRQIKSCISFCHWQVVIVLNSSVFGVFTLKTMCFKLVTTNNASKNLSWFS